MVSVGGTIKQMSSAAPSYLEMASQLKFIHDNPTAIYHGVHNEITEFG